MLRLMHPPTSPLHQPLLPSTTSPLPPLLIVTLVTIVAFVFTVPSMTGPLLSVRMRSWVWVLAGKGLLLLFPGRELRG